jgi:O-antigen/teichoic acid export membrane protein
MTSPSSTAGAGAGTGLANGPSLVGQAAARAGVHLFARVVILRVVSFVTTVILARILSPADFGLFAIVGFAVTALSLVGDLGVGSALIQQDKEPSDSQLGTAWAVQPARN